MVSMSDFKVDEDGRSILRLNGGKPVLKSGQENYRGPGQGWQTDRAGRVVRSAMQSALWVGNTMKGKLRNNLRRQDPDGLPASRRNKDVYWQEESTNQLNCIYKSAYECAANRCWDNQS